MMSEWEKSLEEIVRHLNKCNLPYMVVGGIANIIWGLPRNTVDIDITIWVEEENLEETVRVITDKFKTNLEKPLDFARKNRVIPIQTSQETSADIILGRLPFERGAISRAQEIEFGDVKFKVCTPEDLIIMKIISERAKDKDDVEGIIKNRGRELDRIYLDKHIQDLSKWLDRSDILEFYEQCWRLSGDE